MPSLRGIMKKMPLIGICFAVAALAVTGVPPFNGFFSKFSIFAGGFEVAQTNPWVYVLVIIAILGGFFILESDASQAASGFLGQAIVVLLMACEMGAIYLFMALAG